MLNRRHLPPGPSFFAEIGKRPKPKLEYLTDLLYYYGDVIKIPGFVNNFMINHVETIGEILVNRPFEFTKKSLEYQRLRKFLGKGLLTSDSEDWKNHRRLLQPIFHRQSLIQTVPLIIDTTCKMIERWQSAYIAQNKTFNLTKEMLNLTLTISGAALFSEDLTNVAKNITRWVNKGHNGVTNATILSRFWPTFTNGQFYSGLYGIEQFAKLLIHKRRQNPQKHQDLLTLLLESKEANDEIIIDEIKTFLVTGHETTGYALVWVFWHLMKHADILEKAIYEVDTVLGNRKAKFDDVNQLTYLRMIIEETMRIYPPIWVFTRKSLNAFKIKNYTIPANSSLIICAYTLHRHPLYWPMPEKFDPDRFLPENVAARPKLAYLPFGAGPHVCIAGSFAMLKITLILATMLQKVVIENKPGLILKPKPQFSLRQNKPFWVNAQNRSII